MLWCAWLVECHCVVVIGGVCGVVAASHVVTVYVCVLCVIQCVCVSSQPGCVYGALCGGIVGCGRFGMDNAVSISMC